MNWHKIALRREGKGLTCFVWLTSVSLRNNLHLLLRTDCVTCSMKWSKIGSTISLYKAISNVAYRCGEFEKLVINVFACRCTRSFKSTDTF